MRGWSPRAGALVRAARVQLHATGRDTCARLGNPQGTPADLERRTGRRAPEPRPLRRADGLYLALRRRSPDRTRQTAGFHAGAVPLRGAPASNAAASGWTPIRPVPRSSRQPAAAAALGSRLRTTAVEDPARQAGRHRPARLRRPRCGRWTSARAAAGQPGGRRLAQHDGRPDPPAAHAGRRRAAPPAAWLDQLEDTLVLHLLYNQPNTWRGGPAATPPRRLALAEAYMRAHLATPMTLKDIARHAGASDTALTRLFQEHRDTTPMNALRAAAGRGAPAPAGRRLCQRHRGGAGGGLRPPGPVFGVLQGKIRRTAQADLAPGAVIADARPALAPAPAIRCRMPAR